MVLMRCAASRHRSARAGRRLPTHDDYVIFRRCPTDAGRVFEMTDYNGGGHAMRMSFVLPFLLTTFSVSAAAADADQNLKQEVEKVASAYAQSFNRQDGAGIAALYASGGMYVNPAGPRTDIAQFSEEAFKAGFNHLDITINQVWPFGTDAALAMGESRMTGKNQSGAPIEGAGLWTAVDVREGGNWKIRMLSIIPKPPQPPK